MCGNELAYLQAGGAYLPAQNAMEKSMTNSQSFGIKDELIPDSCVVCGISFHRSPVAVRERVAVPCEKLSEALCFLTEQPGVRECMLLSTCNRTEVYLSAEEWLDGREIFFRFARSICGFDASEIADQVYVY